jgi:hypothetical protein
MLTDRRKQEGDAIKVIYESNMERRVRFLKNNMDGTFGFVEDKFCDKGDYNYWLPTENGAGSRLNTIADAIREATGRVAWLGAALNQSHQ